MRHTHKIYACHCRTHAFTISESVNEDADSSISGEGSSSLEASSVTDITTKSHYEAESPDELALVQASSTYGCKLKQRTPDRVVVELPGVCRIIDYRFTI